MRALIRSGVDFVVVVLICECFTLAFGFTSQLDFLWRHFAFASLFALGVLIVLFDLRRSNGLVPRAVLRLTRSRHTQIYILASSLAGIAGILFWIAVIRLGDWTANLASYYGDADNIAAYAAYHTHPDRYVADPFGLYASKQISASILNWGPILLADLTHASVLLLGYLVAIIQAVFIGLAMMWFAHVMVGGIAVPIIASLLFVCTSTWNQNLAEYGVALGVPYAGILVLPILLLAFAEVLRNRNVTAACLLAFAALVHPSLAVYGGVIFGFYFLFSGRSITRLLFNGLTLLPCIVIIIVSYAMTQNGIEQSEFVTRTILRLPNSHFNPTIDWLNFQDIVISYFGWLILGFVSAAFGWQHLLEPARRLIVATLAAVVVLLAAAVIGFAAPVLAIVQLVPHRATTLLPIILLPIVVQFFWCTARRSLVAKFAVIQLSSFLIIANWGFFWPPVLSLVLIGRAQTRSHRQRFVAEAGGAVLLLGLSYFAAHDWVLYQPWLAPGFRPGPSWHEGIFAKSSNVAASIAMIWFALELASPLLLATRDAGRLKATSAAFFILALGSVAVYHEEGKAREADFFTRSTATQDLLDAQRWAALHSKSDAVFIVGSFPFRSMSERAVVHIAPSFGYIYTRSTKNLDFDRRVIAFFGLIKEWDGASNLLDFLQVFAARKATMSADDILQFAVEFGGDYFVQHKGESPLLDLPALYTNSTYAIYQLPGRNALNPEN